MTEEAEHLAWNRHAWTDETPEVVAILRRVYVERLEARRAWLEGERNYVSDELEKVRR